MDGAPKIQNVSRDMITPLSGTVCRPSAGTLATINLHTKYEVFMFTHYEDMKGDEKCKHWYGLGEGVRVTQGHRKHHHLLDRM